MKKTEILPAKIDFYGQGQVEMDTDIQAPDLSPIEHFLGVAVKIYSIDSDSPILLLIAVDRGLDSSVYCEVGNLLAAHVANGIADQREQTEKVLISPPEIIESAALKRILSSTPTAQLSYRRYNHSHNTNIIPIESFVISYPEESSFRRFGNA